MEKLDTKSRKKAFDQLFKATIIPFFEKEGFCNLSQALYLLTSRFNFKTSAPKSAPLNLAQFSTYIDCNKFKPFHSHFQT